MARKRAATYTPSARWPFFLVEFLGLAIAFYMFGSKEFLFSSLPCPRSSPWLDCSESLNGPYSSIGPFDISVLGLVYFIVQLCLTAGIRDSMARWSKVLLAVGGVFFLAWLRSLEIIYIKKICPWCWGVMFVTITEIVMIWYLAAPPLPRMKWFTVTGLVTAAIILATGLVSLLELGLGFGKMMKSYHATSSSWTATEPAIEPEKPRPTPTPKPTATATPRPAATPKPTVAVTEATAVIATPTPTPVPTAALPVVPIATPAGLDPEPVIEQNEKTRILKQRGWHHAYNTDSVVRAIKAKPPVLLLAYSPTCLDCEKLITRVLTSPALDSLPVTKMAIQEEMLAGELDEMVKAIPTILLFDAEGVRTDILTGSDITPEALAAKIRAAAGQ